jgi:hypothetical protein
MTNLYIAIAIKNKEIVVTAYSSDEEECKSKAVVKSYKYPGFTHKIFHFFPNRKARIEIMDWFLENGIGYGTASQLFEKILSEITHKIMQ